MFTNIKKCFLIILLQFSELAAAATDFQPPPNISLAQKEAFTSWKASYLLNNTHNNNAVPVEPSYINELALSQSPYLKQHANNPVNWKPWSNFLLKKAKQENKLIFLSIGYSSCHWCHVMNEESFSSTDLAKLINRDFYAIKVDREELPHIDSYYMSALQSVKHSGGWPITAIINGDGLVVYIDSYLPKKKLMLLLPKINSLWLKQPNYLLSIAKNIESMIKSNQPDSHLIINNSPSTQKASKDLLTKLSSTLIYSLDKRYGGFKSHAKFPSEPMLLYAINQLMNAPNTELEKIVKLQLDNMIAGELYDHISGGFHRYATKPNWTSPHFEKTLYNQAQLMLVYAKAFQYFHIEKYRETVRQTADFLLADFDYKKQGFMSAIDADYQGEEGRYYLWDKTELDGFNLPTGIHSTYKISGSNKLGIIFKQVSSKQQKNQIKTARSLLLLARKKHPPPHYDNKIITGWNGLAIKALVKAGNLLHEPKYTQRAKSIAEYLWKNRFDKDSGILHRNNYQTTDNIVYLSDYAYLSDGFLALYDSLKNKKWLSRAGILVTNARNKFENEKGEIFNNSHKGNIYSSKNSSDSSTLSPYSVFLSVEEQLNRRTSQKTLTIDRNVYFKNLLARISTQPIAHLSDAKTLSDMVNGNTENIRYFANANGRIEFYCVEFSTNSCQKMEIEVRLKDNWHINSDRPLQDHLIATQIIPNKDIAVDYPNSELLTLDFQKEPISVFSGVSKITLEKTNHNLGKAYLILPLQACNDHLCLLPEKLKFVM